MRVFVGVVSSLGKSMPGYVTSGRPLYTEEGGDIFKGPRNVEAAKRLLGESGYASEPITLMAAQDIPAIKAFGDLTVGLLKRLDMNVGMSTPGLGPRSARGAPKSPTRPGGW